MKGYLIAVLIGAASFALSFGLWHAYVDHQHIDALWQLVNQPRPAASQPAGK